MEIRGNSFDWTSQKVYVNELKQQGVVLDLVVSTGIEDTVTTTVHILWLGLNIAIFDTTCYIKFYFNKYCYFFYFEEDSYASNQIIFVKT